METSAARTGAVDAGNARVVLAPLAPEHARPLFALLNDIEVVRMLQEVPWPVSPTDVAKLTDAQPRAEADDFVVLIDGEPAGIASIKHPGTGHPPRTMPRLGYWTGRAHWGRGVGTEVARALAAHAFGQHDGQLIGAGVFRDNPASRRVLEKVGFVAVGTKSSVCRSRGGEVETTEMHLARDAWRGAAR